MVNRSRSVAPSTRAWRNCLIQALASLSARSAISADTRSSIASARSPAPVATTILAASLMWAS
jgi:hypothetical protein